MEGYEFEEEREVFVALQVRGRVVYCFFDVEHIILIFLTQIEHQKLIVLILIDLIRGNGDHGELRGLRESARHRDDTLGVVEGSVFQLLLPLDLVLEIIDALEIGLFLGVSGVVFWLLIAAWQRWWA